MTAAQALGAFLATLVAAIAFGLWQQSTSAGVFAFFALGVLRGSSTRTSSTSATNQK